MLPQKFRLRHDKDIKTLFAQGKGVFRDSIGMKFRKNKFPHSRFAVIVGVKTAKKAVARNRIKRRVRAILEKHLGHIQSGFDVAFLPKKNVETMDFMFLERQIIEVLKKAKIFKI